MSPSREQRRRRKNADCYRRVLLAFAFLATNLGSYNLGRSQRLVGPFKLSWNDVVLPVKALGVLNSTNPVESASFSHNNSTNTASLKGSKPQEQNSALSCTEIFARRQAGEWKDPNKGVVHSVKVEEDIPFFVAVHNESYDPIRWSSVYLQKKYYERQVVFRYNHILSSYENPSILIDVGANIGYYSLLGLSRGCSSVIAFEVNPPNLFRICESLQLNEWDKQDRLELYLRGVSNDDGVTMRVNVDIENPGQTGIKEIVDDGSSSDNMLTTNTVSLDSFFTERGWFSEETSDRVVSILKVDIEGREPRVFLGAERLLRSGIVHNVLTEFRRFKRGAAVQALRLLVDADYLLVDEKTKLKLSRNETVERIAKYQKAGKTSRTFDLWFQKAII